MAEQDYQLTPREKYRIMMLQQPLRTKELIDRLNDLEQQLTASMASLTQFRSENRPKIPPASGDSDYVKELIAQLPVPAVGDDQKKLTLAERSAWIQRQRSENEGLKAAISEQEQIAFQIEVRKNDLDIIREKMANVRAVIAVKTAQTNFLAGA